MPFPLAQDPDELFDVVTADGDPTGIVKRRADVHRDGDWHRAIHVWVYGVDAAGPWLLMNQRGRDKDTWPLALDATVGGHLAAGESVAQAYRETEEEIGVTVAPEALRDLGRRVKASDGNRPGVLDREIQEIFLLRDDRPLAAFRPNPAELEGLVRIDLDDATRLFVGELGSVPGIRLRADTLAVEEIRVDEAMLIPVDDAYFLEVAMCIHAHLAGRPGVTLWPDTGSGVPTRKHG